LLPFAATFFNFLDYLKPALRLGCLTGIHSIYVFTHDSVFLGVDGPTHQPIEQLATLRATPNCYVVRPADSLETLEAWKLALARKGAPWALVLTRQKVPFLGARDAAVSRGAYILSEADGGDPDLVLIATGSEVSLAVDAKKILQDKGVRVRVVSCCLRRSRPACRLKRARPWGGPSTSGIAASRSASITSARPRRAPTSPDLLDLRRRTSPTSPSKSLHSPLVRRDQ
jgi:transketolase